MNDVTKIDLSAITNDPSHTVYVAVTTKPVGVLHLDGDLVIQHVYVLPEERRHGVAKALLQHAGPVRHDNVLSPAGKHLVRHESIQAIADLPEEKLSASTAEATGRALLAYAGDAYYSQNRRAS